MSRELMILWWRDDDGFIENIICLVKLYIYKMDSFFFVFQLSTTYSLGGLTSCFIIIIIILYGIEGVDEIVGKVSQISMLIKKTNWVSLMKKEN